MKIALDYDDTYTADPVFWNRFIELVSEFEHEVTFVTFRMEDWSKNDITKDNEDIKKSSKRTGVPIIFSNGLPKKNVYQADIWIDDKPQTIFTDYYQLLKEGIFAPKEKHECKT